MRADLLALIAPVPGTVTKNKRDIMKTIFEHMLAEDTRTNETSVVRMNYHLYLATFSGGDSAAINLPGAPGCQFLTAI